MHSLSELETPDAPVKKKLNRPFYKKECELLRKQNEAMFMSLVKTLIIACVGWIGFIVTLIILFV